MNKTVTNQLLLEHLKAIRGELSALRGDVADLKADSHGLKSHMAGFMQGEVAQDSSIASIRERLERVERRLDIIPAE